MEAENKTKSREEDIKKIKELLKFLEDKTIKNEESYTNNIKTPLDEIFSKLKYVPIDNSLENLPPEIILKILSYISCKTEVFLAASVCQKWKDILKDNLVSLEEVNIGKHCPNLECEKQTCFKPEEMLKASITLKLNVPLQICHSIENVDSELVTKALTSADNIIISGSCTCHDEKLHSDWPGRPKMTIEQLKHLLYSHKTGCGCRHWRFYTNWLYQTKTRSVMTNQQWGHLLEALGNGTKVMESLKLTDVDFEHYTPYSLHETLANIFTSKVKKLTLNRVFLMYTNQELIKVVIRKLLQDTTVTKLTHLTLSDFIYPDELATNVADAICKIEHVRLIDGFLSCDTVLCTVERLIKNILNQNIKMKSLYITKVNVTVIDTQDLCSAYDKMEALSVTGKFSAEQVEALRAVPGMQISDQSNESDGIRISKGFLQT